MADPAVQSAHGVPQKAAAPSKGAPGEAEPQGHGPQEPAVAAALAGRSIALIGMMGAGKSSIGRRLAVRLGIPFTDADAEIVAAAGMTIAEIFAAHGEPYFRSGEARVIARLLEGSSQVLATGGGSFMNPTTQAVIRRKAVSIWLKADYDVLLRRVRRRNDRPMLSTEDPESTLRRLLTEREPIYALADLTILSRDVPHDTIVSEILVALARHIGLSRDQMGPPAAPGTP